MRAEQSLPPTESARELCPACGAANATGLTRTGVCVYLRCEKCQHVWSIPERRNEPRATDTSRVF
jgi:hypothetical protein